MESSIEANMGIALLQQCNSFRVNKQEKLPERKRVLPLAPERPGFKSVCFTEHM